MRILILGVSGLIGHQLLKQLSQNHETFGTLHKSKQKYGNLKLLSGFNIIENVDVNNFKFLKGIISTVNPDVILNCVGITKRKIKSENILETLQVNALFPHKLAEWALLNKKRIIHFSTDCVFNGNTGNYTENSLTTAEDIYGRTKALGEIKYPHTLTIRSSFIGRELFDKTELLEWFLAQDGKVINGFKNTFYSGVSTIFMSKLVDKIISEHPNLSGLYQLSPENPISKYDLLCIAKRAFKLEVEILVDEVQVHNPTLNSIKLRKELNLALPTWEEMMNELALE
jgi:dTDP-4-dehydrorhamnose reductase